MDILSINRFVLHWQAPHARALSEFDWCGCTFLDDRSPSPSVQTTNSQQNIVESVDHRTCFLHRSIYLVRWKKSWRNVMVDKHWGLRIAILSCPTSLIRRTKERKMSRLLFKNSYFLVKAWRINFFWYSYWKMDKID